MISQRSRVLGFLAVAAIATSAVACTGSSAATPSATTKVVATAPADQLVVTGKLTVCSDIPYPPQEFFDANGNPTGSDIDLGAEIAARMGLQEVVENTIFDSIIAALKGNKCDIVISAQNITPDRLAEVDMIPFFHAGQSFVVAKGNPSGLKTTADLCGKSVGVEDGTTEADHLNGTGDNKTTGGLNKASTDGGKAAIDVQPFTKDSDALLALQSSKVIAYFTDSPVAGYYVSKQPDKFELLAGVTLDDVKEGISVSKDKTGLRDAVKACLQSMIDDGTYLKILNKYGVQADAVTSTNS